MKNVSFEYCCDYFPLESHKTAICYYSLEEVQSALQNKEMDCLRMAEEVERTRTLESKAFQEKEQLRSKLEELYEEKERIFQVHLCVGCFHVLRTCLGGVRRDDWPGKPGTWALWRPVLLGGAE